MKTCEGEWRCNSTHS